MQTLVATPYRSLKVGPGLSTGGACCASCAAGLACEGACPGDDMLAALRGQKATTGAYGRRRTGDAESEADALIDQQLRDPPGSGGDAGDGSDDGPDIEALGQKWANLGPAARRDALRRIGQGAGLSDGATERMVSNLVGQGIGAVNTWLRTNAGVEIARINANRDITVARIRAQGGGGAVNPIDGNTTTTISGNQNLNNGSNSSSDNTMLYVGLGLAALWAMKGRR